MRRTAYFVIGIAALCGVVFCLQPDTVAGPRTSDPPPPIVVPKIWDARNWSPGRRRLPVWQAEFHQRRSVLRNAGRQSAYVSRLSTAFEPPGYRDWLRKQGPKPLIEPEKLKTEADWIEAGRQVFEQLDTEISRCSDPELLRFFSDPDAIAKAKEAVANDGVMLDYRWVVDRAGELKVSFSSCAGCHTRIMPDGSLLRGGPGNFDAGESPAADTLEKLLRRGTQYSLGQRFYAEFGVPWLADDPHARFRSKTDDEVRRSLSQGSGAPPGTTTARFSGSPFYTTRMADLIGVKDRKYLDATATHLNRGPADIARYCILVEFSEQGVFGPHKMLPPEFMKIHARPPDEAMYAMALYIYSLKPPKSPYPFDDRAKRGQKIFEAEGCTECHTPPVYTNNKLVAAPGFDPPDDAAAWGLNVSKRRVGTDPGLALKTRKGTGYYKIPSLRGVWYRGLYEHNGSVNSLEDWFDPKRIRDDYVPTGWKGPGVKTRAVPGHKFGHDLSEGDKKALIAFLRTL